MGRRQFNPEQIVNVQHEAEIILPGRWTVNSSPEPRQAEVVVFWQLCSSALCGQLLLNQSSL